MKAFKKFTLSFIALMVLAVSAFAFTGCGETKVDLNKYMTIKIDGADGYARAYANFDYDSFEKDYANRFKVTSSKKYQALNDVTTDMLISLCVDWDMDKKDNLKNGDTVTLKWDCDEETAKSNFKAKLKYSDITVKVKDLKEAAEFDPFVYVAVSFDGYDGKGKANVVFDKSRSEMNNLSVDSSSSNLQGLKNGDVIEIQLTSSLTDSEWASRYGNLITKKTKTYEVRGLQELTEVDPFNDVTVTYTGIAPFVHAKTEYSGDLSLMISSERTSDLKNGDSFTVEVTPYNQDSLESKGYKLSETKKTYTVEKVSEYVTSTDQITEDALGKMQEQAESAILSYAAGWAEAESLKSYDYLGSYLFVRKDPRELSVNNYIYLVYVLHAENTMDGVIDDYYYVRYENAIYYPEDDTCQVDINKCKEPYGYMFFSSAMGEAFLSESKKYYYVGYKDLNSLESAVVTKNLADYQYEATGKLAK